MFFPTLDDPTDLARAYAALDAAWNVVVKTIPESRWETERARLAELIASWARLALDEKGLTQNALIEFRRNEGIGAA